MLEVLKELLESRTIKASIVTLIISLGALVGSELDMGLIGAIVSAVFIIAGSVVTAYFRVNAKKEFKKESQNGSTT
jgi:ABC-type bacteriocin/lantibiotic exporter with double-glycine peptidase domain